MRPSSKQSLLSSFAHPTSATYLIKAIIASHAKVFLVGWEALNLPTSFDFAAAEGYDAGHGDIRKQVMLC